MHCDKTDSDKHDFKVFTFRASRNSKPKYCNCMKYWFNFWPVWFLLSHKFAAASMYVCRLHIFVLSLSLLLLAILKAWTLLSNSLWWCPLSNSTFDLHIKPNNSELYHYSLVVLVTGIQVAIIFLGSGRLDDYVGCLEESLQQTSIGTVNLTDTSIPVCVLASYS